MIIELNPIYDKIQHYKTKREKIEPGFCTKLYFLINRDYKERYESLLEELDTKIQDLEKKWEQKNKEIIKEYNSDELLINMVAPNIYREIKKE